MSRQESVNMSVYILQSMTLYETRLWQEIDRSMQIDIYTLTSRLT